LILETFSEGADMFEREIRLNGLMFGLLHKMLDPIDDSGLQRPLTDAGNSPAWILGHLAVANDYALRSLGEQRAASAEWHKRFRPGATPKDDTSPLPSRAELWETIETGRRRIYEACAKVEAEKMEQPHNSDLFKDTPVKSIGDVVAHLLTSHLALHVGQISAWRRLGGQPPIF
jgi:uncharacterized damage-inducible protein DinB